MRPFESFLEPQIKSYLSYRKGLGYRVKPLTSYLRTFDRYLIEMKADWDHLQPGFFLKMRRSLLLEPRSVNNILFSVSGLFDFLIRRGYLTHNPVHEIPPLKRRFVVPFVFSEEQVDQLLKMLSHGIRKTSRCFLTDLAVYMAILLMARCGTRISEPIKLLRHNYRKDDATIYIENTKFGKHRLVPIPKDVVREIENYLSVRRSLRKKDDNPYLLAGRNQKPLSGSLVRFFFHQAVKGIGLDTPRKTVGNTNFSSPTPHSLRHSYAVNTLKNVRERGGSAQHALPILATYLGHVDYQFTSIYLRVVDAMSRKDLVDFSLWQEKIN
jgi:integrase/recombinase XerD